MAKSSPYENKMQAYGQKPSSVKCSQFQDIRGL
jgi:hypothetical protein